MESTDKSDRVRVGLALSGGAARGIAHVGVLRALVENGVPIDAIAGASAGALIGGCFAAGVTDLLKGELIVLRDHGDLPFAIRASCCIPFFMTPIEDDKGRLLIDGGIVQNLPVSQARDLGADIVIAVDVNFD